MTKIRVISVDYDDCLAPRDFNGDITKVNQKLVTSLGQKPYSTTIGLIGSNRQSVRDDQRNQGHNNNLSCYQQMPIFYQQIGVQFDPFLLPDAYNNVATGTTFAQATSAEHKAQLGYGCPHDTSKISLIYAQMHKIANEHPGIDIDFEFYDDKDHIVNELHAFFAKNRQLIPENINLTFNKYVREMPEAQKTLIGAGPINPYYKQYLKQLGNEVLNKLSHDRELCTIHGDEALPENIRASQYNGNYQFNAQHYEPLLVSLGNPKLLELQLAVAQITKDYLANNATTSMFSLFHFHGETGASRAIDFLAQTNSINELECLKKTINDFIMDNSNGNTHPHSYRTMLFHHFYEQGGTSFSLQDAAKKLSAQTQPLSCWGSSIEKDVGDILPLFNKS